MDNYFADNIKNVCFVGHGRCGKTTLAEALLIKAKVSEASGASRVTTAEQDNDESKKSFSTSVRVFPLEWKGNKINIIDTPGYFDFIGGVYEGIRASDSAVIVVSGKSGVAVGTELAFAQAQKKGIPSMFFVNKLDDEKADYFKVLEELKEKFGKSVAPFVVPVKEGGKFKGFISVIDMKLRTFEGTNPVDNDITDAMKEEIAPIRDMILEAVAETSDELMEKFFSGETFTQSEIKSALKSGVKSGAILPVLCGSAIEKIGVLSLLDSISQYMPSPVVANNEKNTSDEMAIIEKTGEEIKISCSDSNFSAVVFKTISDPYVGKLSIFRVMSGEILPDTVVYNSNKKVTEKIGKIYFMNGKKQVETTKIASGDIGAANKLLVTQTGDTLCSDKKHVLLKGIEYPKANLGVAVTVQKKGEEEKMSVGLIKMAEEDPTILLENNTETHEFILKGMGEQQIETVVHRLKTRYGVEVKLSEPTVPYRETIRKKVRVEGKHRKQSGGHGQYGHVWIEFEPDNCDGILFEEKIFGGLVPKNYFPAVEKGLQECIEHGVLAGFPVVGLKATLVDGSYHAVDSSEMAFKMAAALAYKAGIAQAMPIILEPIGELKISIPEAMMGDVIGDINKRRGKILGMTSQDKMGIVEAEVPMSEMGRYAIDLRSMTQARGSFELEFARYDVLADQLAAGIIEKYKK